MTKTHIQALLPYLYAIPAYPFISCQLRQTEYDEWQSEERAAKCFESRVCKLISKAKDDPPLPKKIVRDRAASLGWKDTSIAISGPDQPNARQNRNIHSIPNH